MELRCKNINRREVVYSNVGHSRRIDSIDLVARIRIVVPTSSQVIKDNLFYILEDDNKIVSQKFNIFNFSFITLWEHNWGQLKAGAILGVIDKDLARELFIYNGNKVSVLTCIDVESICYQFLNFEANVWSTIVFNTMNLIRVGDYSAQTKVSIVSSILSVKKYGSFRN